VYRKLWQPPRRPTKTKLLRTSQHHVQQEGSFGSPLSFFLVFLFASGKLREAVQALKLRVVREHAQPEAHHVRRCARIAQSLIDFVEESISSRVAVAETTLAAIRVARRHRAGRPRQKPLRVMADKGYDSDALRRRLRRRGILLIAPSSLKPPSYAAARRTYAPALQTALDGRAHVRLARQLSSTRCAL
jgi:hypothetical protein